MSNRRNRRNRRQDVNQLPVLTVLEPDEIDWSWWTPHEIHALVHGIPMLVTRIGTPPRIVPAQFAPEGATAILSVLQVEPGQ